MAHTPTPWSCGRSADPADKGAYFIYDSEGRDFMNVPTIAEAEAIVKAVNSHEAFVRLLGELLPLVNPEKVTDADLQARHDARALLAKLED